VRGGRPQGSRDGRVQATGMCRGELALRPRARYRARGTALRRRFEVRLNARVSADELHHLALPMLYGAPAYARPPTVVHVARPFDPDDLPIQAVMTDEERALLQGGPFVQREGLQSAETPNLNARPFSLRSLTDRLRGAGN
jgi:hypothetical protein